MKKIDKIQWGVSIDGKKYGSDIEFNSCIDTDTDNMTNSDADVIAELLSQQIKNTIKKILAEKEDNARTS